MDSPSSSSHRDTRPRLLHSFGSSFLSISHNTLQRMERINNPLGYMSRTFSSIATPIVSPLSRQWLRSLSFFDDRILSIEDKVMFVVPGSSHLFFALDELAVLADSLPKHVDDAIDSLLKTGSTATGQEGRGNERDVVVDVTEPMEEGDEDSDTRQRKTYKEILEGSKEEEKGAVESGDVPILEMLDEGWGMTSLAGGRKGSAQELVDVASSTENTDGLPSTTEKEGDHISESAVGLGDDH